MTSGPEVFGSFGVASSSHWMATQIAMSVLERGGNAFDAATAAGLALQALAPQRCGPGGEMVAIVHPVSDREPKVVCGQGGAPSAATPDAVRELGMAGLPGTGLLAATVPGAFGGWVTLAERWGTWRIQDLLDPVIGLARGGIPVTPELAGVYEAVSSLFTGHWATSAETYLDSSKVGPPVWGRLRLTRLAKTYAMLAAECEKAGADRSAQAKAAMRAWYDGFVAEAVDQFCSAEPWLDATGEPHRGLLRGQDLAGYVPSVEPALRTDFRGVTVCKAPSWSTGPLLGQQLLMLDDLLPAGLDDRDPAWVHQVAEVMKLALADREAWYSDPASFDVPIEALMSREYADVRRGRIDEDASFALRPGSPGGRKPLVLAPPIPQLDPNAPEDPPKANLATRFDLPSGDGVSICVADRLGNVVAVSAGGGTMQSSPAVGDLGFALGTRAQSFVLTDGLASSLRPGARPVTDLSPTLVMRNGRPLLASATAGTDTQDLWQLLYALRLFTEDPPSPLLQGTLDRPAMHVRHIPSSTMPRTAAPGRVLMEGTWPAQTIEGMRKRGHDVVVADAWTLGRTSAVGIDEAWLRAAADRRGATGLASGR